MPFKSEKQRKWMWANDPEMAKKWEKKEKKMKKEQRVKELIKKMVREELAELDEAKERNYKEEYKKYGSSKKAKKYRAELNAYNRKKGTYGNGDGKDASHKGGKIVGFEAESKNRGRAEKSRLKKEEKLSEKVKYKKDKKIGGKWYTKQGTHKHQMKANIIAKREFGRYYDTKVVKEKGGYTIYVKPLKEGKLTEAKETIFDVAARVMKDKQAYGYKTKKGLVKVDMQTANLLMQVFKKVNPKMKKILSDLGYKSPTQLMNTLWAAAK